MSGVSAARRHHVHPLTIVLNLWRVFYLIILPLLRGFIVALQGDFTRWAQGAWFDILVFWFMVTIAALRWWAVTYTCDDRELTLRSGLVSTKVLRVPWGHVTTVSVVESFYLRPFRAARLRADTMGGRDNRVDCTLLLHRRRARELLEFQRAHGGESVARDYSPPTGSILGLGLLTSNSLGGILFMATFISQSGRLLGNEFSEMLVDTFEEVTRQLAFGIPPAAAAIAYFLIAGWFAGFLLTCFRYRRFTVRRRRNLLDISGGMLTLRSYCIRFEHINYVNIRQNFLTKALGLYSLYISAVGYGKQKDDITCVIPTEGLRSFRRHRELLFPAYVAAGRQVKPKNTGFMRFIGAPLTLCGAILLLMYLLVRRFPGWRSFILFVGLMLMVPALVFLTVRFMEFFTGGAARQGRYYTLRYSRGFRLHTVVIPEDKIVGIELRQSLIQRFTPNCDLLVRTRAEKKEVHMCRNLNKAQVRKLLHMPG